MNGGMAIKAIIGLIVLAAVGGGAWYASTNFGTVPESASETVDNAGKATGTFAELMARVGSWKCHAKATHEEGASEGDVYMDGGNIRGDFVATMSGRTVNTSFVTKEGYIYTWSDLLPQGMKVKVDAAAGTAGGQGIDPSTPVEYSCEVWIAEQGKFELPSGIEFFEIGTEGMGGFNVPMPR